MINKFYVGNKVVSNPETDPNYSDHKNNYYIIKKVTLKQYVYDVYKNGVLTVENYSFPKFRLEEECMIDSKLHKALA